MSVRTKGFTFALAGSLLAAGALMPRDGHAQEGRDGEVPRTPWGHPDLQGNWTNETITPIERPEGLPLVLTEEQMAAIEAERQALIDSAAAPSDPDRGAPAVGGEFTGDPLIDAASGGTGGYNYFWLDQGDRVAVWNGEARSSLITFPEDGQIPDLTPEGQARRRELAMAGAKFGDFDNPENRPLAERCIVSFGSNAGPPMLPNYFYNNNYTIVQTPDHVMIMTEMVHDNRIIRLGEPDPLPDDVRPWFGDSWGRWAGDTLVVETTNLPAEQLNGYRWFFGASEDLKVTERFTRADESTIHYEFTVEDPKTWVSAWGGQVPFRKLDALLYEYACHEGNYALENVLRGARAEEAAEREGGSDR
ncbi:MAG: hypothetical protein R3266_09265 [Gemmatimonadota bacterium]|nr:hypothetical protein [Gemmatimonadota bacterium]